MSDRDIDTGSGELGSGESRRGGHPVVDLWGDLVERFRPELVLQNEIDGWRRTSMRLDGRRELVGDYYPRSLDYVLANSRISRLTNLMRQGVWMRSASPMRLARAADQLRRTRLNGEELEDLYLDVFVNTPYSVRALFWWRYWTTAVRRRGPDQYPVTAYVNVWTDAPSDVQTANRVVLQYWFYYVYNDWVNKHEGDWEHVDVVLERNGDDLVPVTCACSAHRGGFQLPWAQTPRSADDRSLPVDGSGTHPIVHVAIGSHANYFEGGRAIPVEGLLTFTDRTIARRDGIHANQVLPATVIVDQQRLREDIEFRFTGHWGSRGWGQGPLRFIPFLGRMTEGPKAPWSRSTWTDPLAWIAKTKIPNLPTVDLPDSQATGNPSRTVL